MKKILLTTFLLVLSSSVFAWTIGPMNYQGRLLDNNGVPVTGSYTFTVSIYDAITGGTLKYSELQNNIAVNDGVYSFLVSTGVTQSGTWDINLWNTPTLYLEIVVNGQTLTPRHLLAATPFAFQANLALTTNNALALGGVSAGQYQNTLADICVSSKGKWLELVSKCLGVGAQFPGPSMVALNTLTASTDLSGLDLSKADISGINFGSVNFTGSVFKQTTFNASGISTANMTNAVWDAVVATGTKTFANNFTGAKISNINMTGWNLSGVTLTNASIADLPACPASLPAIPAQYRCRSQDNQSNQPPYAIVGPNMNFSNTSLLDRRTGFPMFYNNGACCIAIPVTLTGTDFSNTLIESGFGYVDLSNSTFAGSKIRNLRFDEGIFTGVNFDQSIIESTIFFMSQGSVSFHGAKLDSVYINADGTQPVSLSIQDAIFDTVIVGKSPSASLSLEVANSTWRNITFPIVSYMNVMGGIVSDGFYIEGSTSGVSFENTMFVNGNISGDFTNSAFIDLSFTNVSFYGANFTGASMGGNIFTKVNWLGATCPNGITITTTTGTCIGNGI